MAYEDDHLLTVLRQPGFALLWFGQLVSKLGDWVLWVALPFYVYEQTGSTLATGVMFVVQTLPPLLLGSVAGVFVDRWDRKRTMVMSDVLRCFVVLLLITARSPAWLWLIYPLTFAAACLSQFFNPAKSALIPRLVGRQHLMAANTLNSVSDDLTMLVGPALGGVLAGFVGLSGVVIIDATSFLISGVMISLISLRCGPAHLQEEGVVAIAGAVNWMNVWHDWHAGLRWVKEARPIMALFMIMGVAMLGQGIISVIWVIFVREKLGGGALEYGWVQVAVAAGGILGAAIMAHLKRLVSPGWLIAFGGMVVGLLLLATFHSPSLPVILALQILIGVAAIGFFVPIQALLQAGTIDHFLGRVFGAFNATNALLMLCGQGIGGLLADRAGIVLMLDLSAILYFSAGVLALLCGINKSADLFRAG